MIAQLTGTVIQLGPTSAVVEVGGFGVLVLCGPNTTAQLRIGETATLSTSLVVREDSLTLYAFATVDASHTWIMNDARARAMAVAFLRDGSLIG